MANNKDDLDILERPASAQGKRHVIPTNARVLPTLASQCKCELVINQEGGAMLIFNRPLPEGIEWAEYDADLAMLTLVTWDGNIMGLGLKIHPPLRKYLKMAKEIMLIEMTEDTTGIVVMYPAELVVRHIGL